MKYKKCSSCGQDVHLSTQICSLCGATQKDRSSWVAVVAIGIIAIVIVMCVVFFFRDSEEEKAKKAELKSATHLKISAKNAVSSILKDPNSAEFRNQIGSCGEVNSKNSFGGYVGFTRFIVTKEKVLFENEFQESDYSKQSYQQAWNEYCR